MALRTRRGAAFRGLIGLVIGLFFCMFVLLSTAGVAHAQAEDGLDVVSVSTYTPDPANNKIDVVASYTLNNVQPDEDLGDSIRSFFFTTWVVAVPSNVTNFAATAAGQNLTTRIEDEPDQSGIALGSITLPSNLNFGQTVVIDLTFTIPGGEPRSDPSVARVNSSFLAFPIWVAGDPGQTTVRVNIPPGFSMELRGQLDELVEVTREGTTFFEAADVEDPREFFGQVFGRNDTGLITESVRLPDDSLATIRAWPDDPDWADFVVDAIEDDLPTLERLIGLPWSVGDIEVIETVTPYLYGYGGWFNASSGLIEIGENLERDLMLHELGHAWFNDELIDGRWITEGLAEEFASQAIAASGEPLAEPDEPERADPIREQLAHWRSPTFLSNDEAIAYEQYHYNASWWVMRQITNDIGLDAFSQVLVALDNDEIALLGENQAEEAPNRSEWIHLFDLLELRSGASGLDDLFATYVLAEDQADRLQDRRKTHAEYNLLAERSGSWAMPLHLRQRMSEWDFSRAQAIMILVRKTLDARDQNDALADELGVTIEHGVETLYEEAPSAAELREAEFVELQLLEDLKMLSERRADTDDRATDLGVSVSYPPAPLVDALAYEGSLRASINRLADLRAEVDVSASRLGLTSPAWPPIAAGNEGNLETASALAEARLATLDAIETADDRVSGSQSVTERIGLWGSDPGSRLDAARAAYAQDALDEALAASAEADAIITAAAKTGQKRITWTAALVAVAVLATLAMSLRQRTSTT